MDERPPREVAGLGKPSREDAPGGPEPEMSSFSFSFGSGAQGKAFLPFAIVLFLVSCASMAAIAVLGLLGAGAGLLLRLIRGSNRHLSSANRSFKRKETSNEEAIDIEAVEIHRCHSTAAPDNADFQRRGGIAD